MFEIRTAVIDDYSAINYISRTSLGYEYDECKTKAKLDRILKDKTQLVLVAISDNKVCGFIHLADYNTLYADDYKNIMGLAVEKKYQRLGIGKQLLVNAENWAKKNNAFGVRLLSGYERKEAHEFYKACGYDEIKLQKNFKKIL